jgi:urease accessory protein
VFEDRRWKAALECDFTLNAGRTVLSRLRFEGPLRVQRLFYPEKPALTLETVPCHCYLLHPPGGMVGGDELEIRCSVGSGAHCLLTGPSAGKVYRLGSGGRAQRQEFTASLDDAVLEWLPQETILFNGSCAEFSAQFQLGGCSRLIAWDIVCFGRAAAGEAFELGRFLQRVLILRDGRPLAHERLDMEAGGLLWSGPAGLQGASVLATMYACGREDDPQDAAALQAACGRLREDGLEAGEGVNGVTCRAGVLMARYLGRDGAAARRFCLNAWRVVRPLLLGRRICPPRVWNT